MVAANFMAVLPLTLKEEGGFSDHPADPGGATMLGITKATYEDWVGRPVSVAQLKALKVTDVGPIYKKNYWDVVRGDFLASGVDYATFDAAVNSGPGRAKQWLVKSVGGPAATTVKRLCDTRRSFLRGLGTWSTFGKGWLSRVARVEATGVSMALRDEENMTSSEIQAELARQAAEAQAKSNTAGKSAGGAATGTAGGTVAALNGSDPTLIIVLIIIAVVLVFISIAMLHRKRAQAARAKAYGEAAARLGAIPEPEGI